jgi:hypothetical protein
MTLDDHFKKIGSSKWSHQTAFDCCSTNDFCGDDNYGTNNKETEWSENKRQSLFMNELI